MRGLIAALVVLGVTNNGCSSLPDGPGHGGAPGGGGNAACAVPTDCPAPENECDLAACIGGECRVVPKVAGAPASIQYPGDCKSRQCDGTGSAMEVADDTDAPIDGNECTLDLCSNGEPSNPPNTSGPCGVDGKLTCDGAGLCVGCTAPSSCAPDEECRHPTCTGGVCGVETVPQGAALAVQIAGDCKKRQCNGAGGQETVNDDSDVFVDGAQCTADTCSSGTPLNTPVSPSTPCSQGTGKVCDATGACVECITASDCPGTDTECQARACEVGTCGVSFLSPGSAVSSQTVGDCRKQVCDGNGGIVASNDDSDLPNDNNPCTNDGCFTGSPQFAFVELGTACGAGLVCSATGQCQGCNQPIDCGVDDECKQHTCVSGSCGLSFTANGTAVGGQTAGDCKRTVCDGSGNIVSVNDDTDTPADDGNQCTGEVCDAGVAAHPNRPPNAVCSQAGGAFCDGGGTCVECNAPTQCPGGDTECRTRTCVAHACGAVNAAAGFVTSAQVQGDCRRDQCDGLGGIVAVPNDSDLPLDDGLQCTLEVCTAGLPSHPPRVVDFACNQSGGSFCDGSGDCVQCNHSSQCASLVCNAGTHACAAPSCTDGLQNGAETGIDCGGPCPGCGTTATYRFAVIGDYGAEGPGLEDVAAMVHGWDPDAVITVGDNVYSEASEPYDPIDGQYFHDFMSPYSGIYGAGSSSGNRFWPILGNHDHDILPAYLAFFTLPNNERYYDVELAPGQAIHLFGLSGDPREPDGVTASSVQATWLHNRLAATSSCFKIVTIHEPPYASTEGTSSGDDPTLQWPYEAWGADLVMSGDTHAYERLSVGGFPYIVNGVGGGALFGDWNVISPYSVYRFPMVPQRYGAQLITVTIGNGVGTLTAAFYGVGDVTPEDTLTLTKSCN